MSRNHRDRKLTKVQRHIKSGHIGFIPNCPVCMQTSATRRVSENAVEKVDQKPGRTWSADSIYHVDCDSYQGNRYTIVMYNGATGYMSLAFMELRSTAAAKIETAVQRLRDDPRYKSVDQMVEILQCDPAGEWHRKNVEFMSVMKKLRIHFIMRATNADKREMAEGEGAVSRAVQSVHTLRCGTRQNTVGNGDARQRIISDALGEHALGVSSRDEWRKCGMSMSFQTTRRAV